MSNLPRRVRLTPEQEEQRLATAAAFMKYAGFFSHYYYDIMIEHPTLDIPTAATDGKRVFYNPEYFATLKPLEKCFALAHEVYHAIYRHPSRMRFYRELGFLDDLPFDAELFNRAADYCINGDLVSAGIGMCNPEWLYDPAIGGNDLPEDIYKKLYVPPPPPLGNQPGSGNQSSPGQEPSKTYGQSKKAYSKPDKTAQANGGTFDEVLEPFPDPVTGKDDIPTEMDFKEAIAKALDAVEKTQGNMPGGMRRICEEILSPQIDWRQHIRMLVTGKIGQRGETWSRPNRHRLVISSMGSGLTVYSPGRKSWGAELVVCAVDNSGSISERELSAFFGEMTGILQDCKPKNVMVIWCDAAVRKVVEARNLDELAHIRVEGSDGGGGTSFIPPFAYLEEHNLRPDTLVYLTDMYGSFPSKPNYPVIWAATTDTKAPFGETVRIKL